MITNDLTNIRVYAKELGLYNIADSDVPYDKAADEELAYLEKVLRIELELREQKSRQRRFTQSHLPEIKSLDEFDISFNKNITQRQLEKLSELQWMKEKYNIIFIGNAGTGKTHLAVALGNIAIANGHKVMFITFFELINILKASDNIKSYQVRLKYVKECQLLIIDELGYLSVKREDANLFYQFLGSIHCKLSVIITTNLEFGYWGDLLGDEVLATAIVDRLTHKCQIISTTGESYRLAHHQNIFSNRKKNL